jgi:bacterioferritin (cytochrome b1)
MEFTFDQLLIENARRTLERESSNSLNKSLDLQSSNNFSGKTSRPMMELLRNEEKHKRMIGKQLIIVGKVGTPNNSRKISFCRNIL